MPLFIKIQKLETNFGMPAKDFMPQLLEIEPKGQLPS
jgi:hypothetical protein